MAVDIVQKINQLMAEGNFTAALKRIRPLVKKEPRNAGLQNVAGICFARSGSNNAALPYFANATKLAPNNIEFRCNLTLALILSSQSEKAASQIDHLFAAAPEDPRPHYYQALLSEADKNFHDVITHASRALERAPDMTDALNLRALALSANLRTQEALDDFKHILSLKPKDTKARMALAGHLAELAETDAALAEYEKIIELDPTHASAISRLAALRPTEKLVALQAHTVEHCTSKDTKTRVFTALAQAICANRLGHKEDAMQHFAHMHALEAKAHPWKVKPGWAQFDRLTQAFSSDNPATIGKSEEPRPIFIVGLPRSGTTLVEMILSAAPGVTACGELTLADLLERRLLATSSASVPTSALMAEFAQEYRLRMPTLPTDAICFTDKMPSNFRFVGPLLCAFPNARVVNVRRDPRDVALSMWMRRFPAGGMGFTHHLPWIADQANLYQAFMKHWETAYPEKILSIQYEDLVRDLETNTQKLAAHCKVEWSQQMLSPEQNKSRVRTASVLQVRKKVHDGSVGSWTRFGDQISQFTDHLDPALWPDID